MKSIDSLPPTSTILRRHAFDKEGPIDDIRISQGLMWLHKASFHDMKVLETTLSETQSQRTILEKRGKLFQKDLSLALNEWNALCSDLEISDIVNVDTDNISQVVLEWQETQQTPKYQKEKQRITSHAAFLHDVLTNYQHICKRTHQPAMHINALQQVLKDDIEYKDETSSLVRKELEELLSFYQSRRCDSKQTIPAFMTLVASDDIDTLEAYEYGLKQVVKDISSVCGKLVEYVHLLGTRQARVRTAKERVEANTKQLDNINRHIQSLQQNIQWCSKRMESMKKTLEEEIATLLGNDSNVEIKL